MDSHNANSFSVTIRCISRVSWVRRLRNAMTCGVTIAKPTSDPCLLRRVPMDAERQYTDQGALKMKTPRALAHAGRFAEASRR